MLLPLDSQERFTIPRLRIILGSNCQCCYLALYLGDRPAGNFHQFRACLLFCFRAPRRFKQEQTILLPSFRPLDGRLLHLHHSGLLTLKGSFGAYCLHNLTRSPNYATMTPEEVTYFLSNCESKIQLWGIIGGIASLIVFVHYAVVLKQNYMNRLPLSQAIAEATRNSRVNSLNRRS